MQHDDDDEGADNGHDTVAASLSLNLFSNTNTNTNTNDTYEALC
jgi:hypothetical protein